MHRKPISIAIALGLALAGVAIAQTVPTAAQRQELDAARADLDKAAQRLAELHRKYGGDDAPVRIERRVLRKPVIGVLLAPDQTAGVRIAGVTPESAAASAGLRSGDRIVRIAGKPISGDTAQARLEWARAQLGGLDGKAPVALGYERGGKAASVSVTPKVADRLLVVPDGAPFDGDMQVFTGEDGDVQVVARRAAADAATAVQHARTAAAHARVAAGDARRQAQWSAIAPDVHREIIRLRSDCDGADCAMPALAEAFRWNGLNLAAVDARLGRYFGTRDGVLVLSTGKDFDGLEAGDVIRRIGGKAVGSPREAMDALRAQPSDGTVAIEYLRDRASRTAQVKVPKAMPFRLPPPPPMPPVPPLPPAVAGGPQPPRPPAAPGAPGAPSMVERRRYVVVGKDGKRMEWEGDAGDAPPAWVQALPQDGQRVERRVQVIVDDQGRKTIIEDDSLPPPPPAPPAPPAPPKRG